MPFWASSLALLGKSTRLKEEAESHCLLGKNHPKTAEVVAVRRGAAAAIGNAAIGSPAVPAAAAQHTELTACRSFGVGGRASFIIV